ncbi:hypothetical protein O181_066818 [Austropuccinia psidii MF-1]|uniref:Reverse transcriptase/retrotransposon-derived protein RNase H-like domain-containing protein n=1 Tax=Austropuccinia psidii MF-1 TaxID=1389203 RepID=A0A9Q3ES62_9BASI|nr:hypothetical protein [Austropuccinia psidii MF-1]
MQGELEHAVKCRFIQNCTLDEIANTLQDVRKRTNIGKYSQYKISSFKEKKPFRVYFKDKAQKRVEEVTKKENPCHNFPKEEHSTEDSDSDSMGDAIREPSYDYQGSKEKFLVEYQEEERLKIQEIQLEAGIPQDTRNENLCKHTQDAQKFLVTPTKGMAYIHGTSTKMTFCVENAQHPLIIDSGKCTPINLKISLKKCNFGQKPLLALGNKVSGLSLAIDQNQVEEVLQKPVPNNIKEMKFFLGVASYDRNHIKICAHIASILYKLFSKDVVFEITKELWDSYERIKHEIIHAPVLILPDFELPFNLYIDTAGSQGPGAALQQRQIVNREPREGVICYISRQFKDSKARYGATQTE